MRFLRAAALLFASSVLVAAPLRGQVPVDTMRPRVPLPPPPLADSGRADSLLAGPARADTVPKDTVKSPIAVAPRPAMPEVRGRRTVWDRDALFASGALTVAELVSQVPGVTTYFAGFIAAPTASSWYGEPGRVRVFLDGVELDALDAREGGVRDLGVIQLWSLEEVAVERGAGELRVHLRSWRVQLTTPQTRTDILTGSENTNLYRGFFGKRMQSGGVLQLAAQQYSTTSVRTAGDGDGLGAFGRAGVARGRLTVDAVATRYSRTRTATKRNVISGTLDPAAIGAFKGIDQVAYVRVAWADPDTAAFWAQLIASTSQHAEKNDSTLAAGDTVVTQEQYVATVGVQRWGARISGSARLRSRGGVQRVAPALRASWENRWLALSGVAEQGGPDSTSRVDAVALLTPFPWLHLGAAHSVHAPEDTAVGGPTRTTSRAEVGVRVWDRWITAGAVRRSSSRLLGMPVFDADYGPVDVPAANGLEAGLSGRIRGPFSFSWRGIRWDADGPYRPTIESRTELSVVTGLEKWLVRKQFTLRASAIHEWRGALEAPDGAGGLDRAEGASAVVTMLEIRIGAAHVFWYNRNPVGKVYETVPGYLMPRLVQLYGIRWEFWN
ncbi:MAG: TonB-dependent receptor plug domain-containing protein [Gemmatimonadetes bacterium]|nr:TonB-dependent receptor plug domain-containing protein [Gemmatimonadota bacterium]